MEDMVEVLEWVAHVLPAVMEAKPTEFIHFVIVFLGSADYVRNAHLRARLVDVSPWLQYRLSQACSSRPRAPVLDATRPVCMSKVHILWPIPGSTTTLWPNNWTDYSNFHCRVARGFSHISLCEHSYIIRGTWPSFNWDEHPGPPPYCIADHETL